jgi:HAD superfamily hydrolase (TIGR01459 family)
MPSVRRLAEVFELRADYDTFLVDLWGVVHDGERLGEGVAAALGKLVQSGARVVLVSNSSRLGPQIVEGLEAMGLSRDAFHGTVSSGDVTQAALLRRDPAVFAQLPEAPRVLHIGAPSFVPWLFELGLVFDDDVARADLIVATGTVPDDAALESLRARLRPLAARNVPLVCTNPDRVIPYASGLRLGPGAIAHAYASLGGATFLYGKPHKPIYDAALAGTDRSRTVAIGDMIETDIAGARAAGIASVLVMTGVHASELTTIDSEHVFDRHGARPDALLERLA